jgi:hypothetical protein
MPSTASTFLVHRNSAVTVGQDVRKHDDRAQVKQLNFHCRLQGDLLRTQKAGGH